MSKSQANREYYLLHKEKWAYYAKKVHCEICNKDVRKDFYKKHETSDIHKRNLNFKKDNLNDIKASLKHEIVTELNAKVEKQNKRYKEIFQDKFSKVNEMYININQVCCDCLTQKCHELTAPYCPKCWEYIENGETW